MAPKLDCRAPCDFGRVESGGDRLLLAHIRAGFGFAVIAAAVRVVDHGGGIDPDDGAAGAIRFGLRFGCVLVLVRRRRVPRRKRHAAALGDKCAFGLAARLNGGLVGGPIVVALPRRLRLGDGRLRQQQKPCECRARGCGEGRFHHTVLRENSARRLRWKRQRHRTAALAAPPELQPLTGSAIMFSFCSYRVKTNHERRHEKAAAALGTAAELTRYAGRVSARSALKSQPRPQARCSPRFRSAWPSPRPIRSARACARAPAPRPRPCARPERYRGLSLCSRWSRPQPWRSLPGSARFSCRRARPQAASPSSRRSAARGRAT